MKHIGLVDTELCNIFLTIRIKSLNFTVPTNSDSTSDCLASMLMLKQLEIHHGNDFANHFIFKSILRSNVQY